MRVPGRAGPRLASSAAMAAARACWRLVGDTLSMVARGSVIPALSFSINYCMNAEVAGYIAAWRPAPAPPQVAAFARQVVTSAAPAGRERAKNLLWAAGKP